MHIPPEFQGIPGYAAAVERENKIRDAAILNLNTRICGVEIEQMTLRHWIILDGVGSPLLGNATPLPEQVMQFLWIMSPAFKPKSEWRKFWFARRNRKIPYGEAVNQIRQFVDDAFQDFRSGGDSSWEAPSAGFGAHVIYAIAVKFHWARAAILNLPLKESFQYLKLFRIASASSNAEIVAAKFNPSDFTRLRAVREERERRKLCTLRFRIIDLLKTRNQ